jgi:hypothetical protein
MARDINPFDNIFRDFYGRSLISTIVDSIDATIGVLSASPPEETVVQLGQPFQKGYVFIAMAMDSSDTSLDDVLDALKEGCRRCGLEAERVDEPASNDRITDRILESIRKAEYVVVDLTHSKPNVFYEAGYAHGLGRTPIYVAKEGTKLEFDLKDYPVIFYSNMRQLKDKLEKRLRGLASSS